MEVRSGILKKHNLPQNGIMQKQCHTKPYLFLIVFFTLGLILMMIDFYLPGILLCAICGSYLLFVKDIILITFYEDYAVFNLLNGKEEYLLLYYRDIQDYHIVHQKGFVDDLNIQLSNCHCITLQCAYAPIVKKYFDSYQKGAR